MLSPRAAPALVVTTASQAAARDAAAIASGTDSFALMTRAATEATAVVVRRYPRRLGYGVTICAGAGNNGGDGWVMAAQLARLGARVRVLVAAAPRTADARRAEQLARLVLPADAVQSEWGERSVERGIVVDALLGTGARGPLRGAIEAAAAWCHAQREGGAIVVSLDVPTGLDATTGALAAGHVMADQTVTFGTVKYGLLAARGACGVITLVDIGLGSHASLADGAPVLADATTLATAVPAVAWDAHKGQRGRVEIVGGAPGMAGAVQLAAHGALVSGAGLVRAAVHPRSLGAVQVGVPAAMGREWTGDGSDFAWAHTLLLGPGLGQSAEAQGVLHAALAAFGAPQALVLDADALNLLANHDGWRLLQTAGARGLVVLTPHPGELSRLQAAAGWGAGRTEEQARSPDAPEPTTSAPSVSASSETAVARLAAVRELAAAAGAIVVAKGTPTLVVAPNGDAWVSPRGAPALGTGGTGDVLAGMIAAVLGGSAAAPANAPSMLAAVAAAVYVHGTAGELAASAANAAREPRAGSPVARVSEHVAASVSEHVSTSVSDRGSEPAADAVSDAHQFLPFANVGAVRGVVTLDIVHAIAGAWRVFETPHPLPPGVLAELPAVSR